MPRTNTRDRPDDFPSEDFSGRLPRKPRPVVTNRSSYASNGRTNSENRSGHDRRESHRSRGETPDERRRRRPRDPERERRRQERSARDPDYAARREERRVARRAERRASHQPIQYVDAAAIDRQVNQEDPEGCDEHDLAGITDAPQSPESTCTDIPRPRAAARREYPQQHLEYQEQDRSSKRPRHHSSRHDSRRQASRRRHPSPDDPDDWDLDLERSSTYDEKKRPNSSSTSTFSELRWYKQGTIENGRHYYRDDEPRGCCGFSRRCTCISTIIAVLLLVIIIVPAVVVSQKNKFSYHVSTAQVNETAAFTSGAATRNSVNDTQDGIGAGVDAYVLHQGNATKFLADVPVSDWISFEHMWNNNLDTIKNSCGILGYGDNVTPEESTQIYNAIQDRANASLVDHRLILALILQESKGCVHVPDTRSSGGVKNTGLMQAHNGHAYDSKHSAKSILAMIQDGTQGTKKGVGLVQELNAYYGNPYATLRAYNSGYIPESGELTEAAGATKCYVSDIANRLTGWLKADSTCSE